jgi:hypothetical protein
VEFESPNPCGHDPGRFNADRFRCATSSSATWACGHLELVRSHYRWSAAVATAGSRRGQPSGGALADEVAFEFSQGREHVEDELAAGGGGVDRLLQAAEPDAAVGQAGDGVDQVAQGAAEAVKLPDDQGVTGPELVEELLEDGAVVRAPLAVSVNTR